MPTDIFSMIYAMLIYHGSFLIGLALLFFLKDRKKTLKICLIVQFSIGVLIYAITMFSQIKGYSEWYWFPVFNIPINILFLLIYCFFILTLALDTKLNRNKEEE